MAKFEKRIKEKRESYPFGGKLNAEEMEMVEKLKNGISHKELYIRLVKEALKGKSAWVILDGQRWRKDKFTWFGTVQADNGLWVLPFSHDGAEDCVEVGKQSEITFETACDVAEIFIKEAIG